MIHDACVEVTCDAEDCRESVFVQLNYVYRSTSSDSGYYDSNDKSIEKALRSEHDWIVIDGKHYCEMCGESLAKTGE